MYYHYDKKTGEYLYFLANPDTDNNSVAWTTDPTDFELDASGYVLAIPFRVNDIWQMRPRFILHQY